MYMYIYIYTHIHTDTHMCKTKTVVGTESYSNVFDDPGPKVLGIMEGYPLLGEKLQLLT